MGNNTAKDPRVRSILVNPRLVGIPFAKRLSLCMFTIIIVVNTFLAFVLSKQAQTIEKVPITVLDADKFELDSCDPFTVSRDFVENNLIQQALEGFKLLAFVFDATQLDFTDLLIPTAILQEIEVACSNVLFEDCTGSFNFATILPGDFFVGSTFVDFDRKEGDVLVELVLKDSLSLKIYQSSFIVGESNDKFISIQVLSENIQLEIFTTTEVSSIEDLQRVILQTLFVVATEEGHNEALIYLFSGKVVPCGQFSGLSTFDYFAIMADYSFIAEGIFSFIVALIILKCLGFIATNKDKEVRNSVAEVLKIT